MGSVIILSVSSVCKSEAPRRPSWKGVAACSSPNGRLAASVGMTRALGNLVQVKTIIFCGRDSKGEGRERQRCFSRRGRAESCYR